MYFETQICIQGSTFDSFFVQVIHIILVIAGSDDLQFRKVLLQHDCCKRIQGGVFSYADQYVF